MKYLGMPMGMWALFHRSFRKEMISALGFDSETAANAEKRAFQKYREIIVGLPEFETGDRFQRRNEPWGRTTKTGCRRA